MNPILNESNQIFLVYPLICFSMVLINKLYHNRKSWMYILTGSLLFSLIYAMVIVLFSDSHNEFFSARFRVSLEGLIQAGIVIWGGHFIVRKFSLEFVSLVLFVITLTKNLLFLDQMIVNEISSYILLSQNGFVFSYLILVGLSLILAYVTLFQKLDYDPLFRHLFRAERASYRSFTISLVIFLSFDVLLMLIPQMNHRIGILVQSTVLLLLVLFIVIMNRYQYLNENLASNDAILHQQQVYLKALESIRSELATLQHDAKNIFTSLYLDTLAKNEDAVALQLNELLTSFDESIFAQVYQTVQVANISLLPLKHLILEQMNLFQEHDVKFDLHVDKKIITIPMDVNDFVFCVKTLFARILEDSIYVKEGAYVEVTLVANMGLEIQFVHKVNHDSVVVDFSNDDYRNRDLARFRKILDRNWNLTHPVHKSTQIIRQSLSVMEEEL